jgi:hypothetical protein
LRPWKFYSDIFPLQFDVSKIAIRFEGKYDSYILKNPEIFMNLSKIIELWQSEWIKPSDDRPKLQMQRIDAKRWLLLDTRKAVERKSSTMIISNEQAELLGRDWLAKEVSSKAYLPWAVENKLLVFMDDYYVSIVVCS